MSAKWCIAFLAVTLQACGAPQNRAGAGRSQSQLFEARAATVLETAARGPMLCLGEIASSYPPRCGDVPITNWDWDAVDGEERASGTTWGTYRVTGKYDGTSFTVTDVGPPEADNEPTEDDRFRTPCEQPEGGWPVPDPNRDGEEDVGRTNVAVQNDPEFAGLWIDYPLPATASETRSLTLLNVAFTGNLEQHEVEIREHWGGPLCLVQFERSMKELERIQKELSGAAAEELNLHDLWSDIDVTSNTVGIRVVATDDATRAALNERYGEGVIQVEAALLPK